jgi:hypothetical protein
MMAAGRRGGLLADEAGVLADEKDTASWASYSLSPTYSKIGMPSALRFDTMVRQG